MMTRLFINFEEIYGSLSDFKDLILNKTIECKKISSTKKIVNEKEQQLCNKSSTFIKFTYRCASKNTGKKICEKYHRCHANAMTTRNAFSTFN